MELDLANAIGTDVMRKVLKFKWRQFGMKHFMGWLDCNFTQIAVRVFVCARACVCFWCNDSAIAARYLAFVIFVCTVFVGAL